MARTKQTASRKRSDGAVGAGADSSGGGGGGGGGSDGVGAGPAAAAPSSAAAGGGSSGGGAASSGLGTTNSGGGAADSGAASAASGRISRGGSSGKPEGAASSSSGAKRSAPPPERASKRSAPAPATALAAASGTLGLGPLIGSMVREYLRPTYVFTVSSAQSESCCGEGGDGLHGVYGSAQLARGAARQVLFDMYRCHTEQGTGPCSFESFLDLDAYDAQGVPQLRAACLARGLQCAEGVAPPELRTSLRLQDFQARLEPARAAARAAGGCEGQAEDELNEVMCEEHEARHEAAIARFLSGALDAGKAFSEQEELFSERWEGEDKGGRIDAP